MRMNEKTEWDCMEVVRRINSDIQGYGFPYRLEMFSMPNSRRCVKIYRVSGTHSNWTQTLYGQLEGTGTQLLEQLHGFQLGVPLGLKVPTEPTPADKVAEHLDSIEESLDTMRGQVANERGKAQDLGDVDDLARLAESLKMAIAVYTNDEDLQIFLEDAQYGPS